MRKLEQVILELEEAGEIDYNGEYSDDNSRARLRKHRDLAVRRSSSLPDLSIRKGQLVAQLGLLAFAASFDSEKIRRGSGNYLLKSLRSKITFSLVFDDAVLVF
jgi:hypothetical protein